MLKKLNYRSIKRMIRYYKLFNFIIVFLLAYILFFEHDMFETQDLFIGYNLHYGNDSYGDL